MPAGGLEEIVRNNKYHIHSHRIHAQAGFTLIEVMIALVVFMVVALGLASGELTALYIQRGNDYREEALRIAEDEMTRLKGQQFSTLNQAAWSAPQNFTARIRGGTTTFATSTQIANLNTKGMAMRRIDVAVGWTQGTGATSAPTQRNRQAFLSSIITQSD